MKKFEYKQVYKFSYDIKGNKVVDYLNEEGQDGWELIQINKQPVGSLDEGGRFLFKREIN